jgi:hypothetical protein
MSEVDRLSNSGLYPALPMGEKRGSGEGSEKSPRPRPPPIAAKAEAAPEPDAADGTEPKPIIDEYA